MQMYRYRIIKNIQCQRVILLLTFCSFLGLAHTDARQHVTQLNDTTDSSTQRIIDYIESAMNFNLYNPCEKVYLHFDNTGYFKGEYIRFKAYITRCDTERKTDLSHVLYVELVNPSGDIVEKRKLKITNGEAEGDIKIDSIQTTGFYEVRAYTRYMTNWGTHACFSRVFPIFKTPQKEGDYSHPEIDRFSYQKRLPNTRKDEDNIIIDTYTHAVSIKFYPEGGDLVEGLKSKVAFITSNEDGLHIKTTGAIVDNNDKKICDIATDSAGRGIFELTPQQGMKYYAIINATNKKKTKKIELPVAKNDGSVIRLNTLDDINITATISNTSGILGRLLGYVVMHNGTIVRCDTMTATPSHELSFNRYVLPEGVNQLTVFDSNGQILSDRLFFICPTAKESDSIQITSTTTKLTPCCKVQFRLQTEPNTSISFSAMDASTMNNGAEGNMKTWMLLSSEVKGYIEHPEYYFEADDEQHRKAADLLMMIQGWRRYDFRLMAGLTEQQNKQPIEDKLYLFGQVKSKKKKYTPDDVDISAYMYNKKGEVVEGKLKTDSIGRYNYIVPDIEGEWSLQMVSKKEDKERDYYICIDRNFSPDMRYIYPYEAAIQPLKTPNFTPSALKQTNVEDNDDEPVSITKRTHMLPTVKIKAVRRVLGDLKVLWYDETSAQKHSVIKYDCDEDADKYADNGEDIPYFFDWLKSKNPFFDYETIIFDDPMRTGYSILTDHTTYHERPIIWIIDNTFWGITGITESAKTRLEIYDSNNKTGNISIPDYLDVVKSLYISDDVTSLNKYVLTSGLEGLNAVVFYVYQHPTFGFKQKGLRRTHFEGFNVPTAFEMDDYSVIPPTEDFRRTLYWAPNILTDNRGRATVEFYNNSSCTSMYISAEGMTEEGQILINE